MLFWCQRHLLSVLQFTHNDWSQKMKRNEKLLLWKRRDYVFSQEKLSFHCDLQDAEQLRRDCLWFKNSKICDEKIQLINMKWRSQDCEERGKENSIPTSGLASCKSQEGANPKFAPLLRKVKLYCIFTFVTIFWNSQSQRAPPRRFLNLLDTYEAPVT